MKLKKSIQTQTTVESKGQQDQVGSHLKYVKLPIDELEKEKFTCNYTFIEVEGLMDNLRCKVRALQIHRMFL